MSNKKFENNVDYNQAYLGQQEYYYETPSYESSYEESNDDQDYNEDLKEQAAAREKSRKKAQADANELQQMVSIDAIEANIRAMLGDPVSGVEATEVSTTTLSTSASSSKPSLESLTIQQSTSAAAAKAAQMVAQTDAIHSAEKAGVLDKASRNDAALSSKHVSEAGQTHQTNLAVKLDEPSQINPNGLMKPVVEKDSAIDESMENTDQMESLQFQKQLLNLKEKIQEKDALRTVNIDAADVKKQLPKDKEFKENTRPNLISSDKKLSDVGPKLPEALSKDQLVVDQKSLNDSSEMPKVVEIQTESMSTNQVLGDVVKTKSESLVSMDLNKQVIQESNTSAKSQQGLTDIGQVLEKMENFETSESMLKVYNYDLQKDGKILLQKHGNQCDIVFEKSEESFSVSSVEIGAKSEMSFLSKFSEVMSAVNIINELSSSGSESLGEHVQMLRDLSDNSLALNLKNVETLIDVLKGNPDIQETKQVLAMLAEEINKLQVVLNQKIQTIQLTVLEKSPLVTIINKSNSGKLTSLNPTGKTQVDTKSKEPVSQKQVVSNQLMSEKVTQEGQENPPLVSKQVVVDGADSKSISIGTLAKVVLTAVKLKSSLNRDAINGNPPSVKSPSSNIAGSKWNVLRAKFIGPNSLSNALKC